MSPNQDHEREFTRVSIRLSVKVSADMGSVLSDQTRDVAMKGLFLHADKQFPVGTECDVVLMLEGGDMPLEVQVRGRVKRCTADGMGLEFTEIPLESYAHLQNIVLYNSQNSHAVEKEIRGHLGLKRPQ